jgi:predicted glycosyltransferase involved in capsule biosynthesis
METTIIVPFRSDNGPRQKIWDWVKTRYQNLYPKWDIIEYDTEEKPFNRGASRNEAVKQAKSKYIVLADADVVPVDYEYLHVAIDMLESGVNWVLPYDYYYNLNQQTTDLVLNESPNSIIDDDPTKDMCEFWRIQSWAGLIVMRKQDFIQTGGYDPRFKGWGYEDNAFAIKNDALIGAYSRIEYPCIHLWHPVSEGSGFTNENIEENRALYKRYESASRNRAKVQGIVNEYL